MTLIVDVELEDDGCRLTVRCKGPGLDSEWTSGRPIPPEEIPTELATVIARIISFQGKKGDEHGSSDAQPVGQAGDGQDEDG